MESVGYRRRRFCNFVGFFDTSMKNRSFVSTRENIGLDVMKGDRRREVLQTFKLFSTSGTYAESSVVFDRIWSDILYLTQEADLLSALE